MRITNKLQKAKLNNKGMSLVEVIIAITILSIVIVPTLRAMTIAMTYNGKARIRQELNLCAESVMETFKGYDLETLEQIFSNGGKISHTNDEGVVTEESLFETFTGGSYSVNGSGDIFTIDDLTMNNGRKYGVKIELTPVNKDIFMIDDIDSTKDAFIRLDEVKESDYINSLGDLSGLKAELDKIITDEGMDKSKVINLNGEEIYNGSGEIIDSSFYEWITFDKRIIKITISEEGSDSVNVNVDSTYKYSISDFVIIEPVNEEQFTIKHCSKIGNSEVNNNKHNKSYNKDDFERFILLYYPNYNDGSAGDEIQINVKNNLNIDGYIIKQRNPEMTDSACRVKDGMYSYKISFDGLGKFNLYDNLHGNIMEVKKLTKTEYSGTNKAGTVKTKALIDKEELEYFINMTITDKSTGTETKMDSSMIKK